MNAILSDRFEIATDNEQKGTGLTMFSKLAAKISNVSTLEKKDPIVKMYVQNGKAEKEEAKQVETKTEVALAPAAPVVVSVEEAKTPVKTLDELLEELAQVDAQKERLEALIKDVRNASKAASIARLKEEMKKAGIDANELLEVQPRVYVQKIAKTEGSKRGPVEAKYRGPEGQLWTGRGREPLWIAASGKPKEHWLI